MIRKAFYFLSLISLVPIAFSQTVLKADGPGNTYELINSVLAPGYNVVEAPDCNHGSFGRHIEEVFDSTLNAYAFGFHIHTFPDNDRCQKFDRQRNEIKAYDKSPDSLLAVENERVQYKWKFKIDSTFQPSSSFTHLHQIKAVGGTESSMPLITLTARKANPNRLELRYAESLSQVTIHQTPLAPLQGIWLDVTETITCGELAVGEYEVLISNLSSGDTMFYYKDESIRIWKTNADFLRPKWGIYRSLNDSNSLKDEIVYFADLSIEELKGPVLSLTDDELGTFASAVYPNPTHDFVMFSDQVMEVCDGFSIYDLKGQQWMADRLNTQKIAINHLPPGLYFIELRRKGERIKSVKIVVE